VIQWKKINVLAPRDWGGPCVIEKKVDIYIFYKTMYKLMAPNVTHVHAVDVCPQKMCPILNIVKKVYGLVKIYSNMKRSDQYIMIWPKK